MYDGGVEFALITQNHDRVSPILRSLHWTWSNAVARLTRRCTRATLRHGARLGGQKVYVVSSRDGVLRFSVILCVFALVESCSNNPIPVPLLT